MGILFLAVVPFLKILWELVCCLKRYHEKVRFNFLKVGKIVFAFVMVKLMCSFVFGMCQGKANSGTDLKYMCHTVKKLMMQRIFVTEKKEDKTSSGQAKTLSHCSKSVVILFF